MTTETLAPRAKDVLGVPLWERLVKRIMNDPVFWGYREQDDEVQQRRWAERILGQTLGFLRVCAADPDGAARLSPSPLVDVGWHAFILHTREYEEFCRNVAGRYIHHSPSDGDAGAGGTAAAVAAMRARGIVVDEQVWATGSASCTPPAG